MEKQLYRSTNNKVISGVCGGIAEYFEIDPTIVRLLWALITITGGIGIIAYIVCIIIIPENTFSYRANDFEKTENNATYSSYTDNESSPSDNNSKLLFGVILVILGIVLVAKKFVHWIDFGSVWPVLLVVAGIHLIVKEKGGKINEKK